MDPQWIIAACAAAGLLITWTTTIAGAVVWVLRRLDANKNEILADIGKKHEENRVRVDAMQVMLIRHDALINPEYNGAGKVARGSHQ